MTHLDVLLAPDGHILQKSCDSMNDSHIMFPHRCVSLADYLRTELNWLSEALNCTHT